MYDPDPEYILSVISYSLRMQSEEAGQAADGKR
jgi:hypothetical protein